MPRTMPIDARTGVTEIFRRAGERLVHVDGEPRRVGRGTRGVGHQTDQRASACSWPPRCSARRACRRCRRASRGSCRPRDPRPLAPTQRSSVANAVELESDDRDVPHLARQRAGPAFLSLPSSDFLSEGAGGRRCGGQRRKDRGAHRPRAPSNHLPPTAAAKDCSTSSRPISWVMRCLDRSSVDELLLLEQRARDRGRHVARGLKAIFAALAPARA